MKAKITYWLLLCLLPLLPLQGLLAQNGLEYPIELCVTPGISSVTFKYNTLPGASVTIYWGDGSSETLADPKSRYAKAVTHTYAKPVAEGTKITIDGTSVTMLEEPWATEGKLNVLGFGEIASPTLERLDFAFACPMSGSTTPYHLDVSRCPQLKVLKVQNLRSITLPQDGTLEELSLSTRLGTPEMPSLQGTLDLTQQKHLQKLKLNTQLQLQAIDLTGLTQLSSLEVYNNPQLRRLIGVKGLSTLRKANLTGNALTYDQLPLFTDQLRESDVNYDQCPEITLDPVHVSPLTIDLSFQQTVQDAKGQSYTTTYPNVMIASEEGEAPNMPIFSDQYSVERGVFKLSESLFTQGGQQLDTLLVGIQTHNDYYPHYAAAAETNQIVARVPRTASEQPTGQARVTFSMNEGGTLSVAIVNPWKELASGDLVERGTKVYIQSELEDSYQVDYYEINGERCYVAYQYLIEYIITDDVDIVAHYKKLPAEGYTITYDSEGGGVIENAYYMDNMGTAVKVKSGDRIPAGAEITFVAKADKGHELDYWRTDGERSLDEGSPFYYELYRDGHVTAVFKELTVPQYPFNFTYGPGGYLSVRLSSTQEIINSGTLVKEGETVYCVATPDPTLRVDKWIVNGEEMTDWRDELEVGVKVDKEIHLEVTFCRGNALTTPTAETQRVYIANDQLIVEGYAADTEMSLYTAQGVLISTARCGEPYDCSALPLGLYLVRIGDQLYRVLVN